MAAQRTGFLNAEKTVFVLIVCLLGFFTWRAVRTEPLPGLPGAPQQKGTQITAGYSLPEDSLRAIEVPNFAEAGSRDPFGQAFDSLRVVAAKVTAVMTVSALSGTAVVDIQYRILPRPISTLRFWLPEYVRLVRVEGDGLTEGYEPEVQNFGENGKQFTVRLRAGVVKKYALRLRLAWLRRGDASVLRVPEVLLLDTTQESGLIALVAAPRTQVAIRTAKNVTPVPIETLRLPEGMTAERPFAAFGYRAHPYEIELGVSEVKVADAGGATPTPPRPPVLPASPGHKTTEPPENSNKMTGPPIPVKEWQLPVSFVGTADFGGRMCVLLKDKSGAISRKFEGDKLHGLTIVKIYPSSAIVENEKGEQFIFKDKLRGEHDY